MYGTDSWSSRQDCHETSKIWGQDERINLLIAVGFFLMFDTFLGCLVASYQRNMQDLVPR